MEPTYSVEIVCLANSRKISGRCVAGKIIAGPELGRWVRPVSSRPSAELSEDDRRFKDGTDPKLLDVVSIPMVKLLPHGFQIENELIDDRFYWSKRGTMDWGGLQPLLDRVPGPLWENRSSGSNGQRDRVAESRADEVVAAFGGSLSLVQVDDLVISVAVEVAAFNNAKRKVRGTFSLSGHRYTLAITDVIVERAYLRLPDGGHDVGNAVLCLSLGEPFYGYAYKLIAAVLLPTAA
jgi:hypothetical protein